MLKIKAPSKDYFEAKLLKMGYGIVPRYLDQKILFILVFALDEPTEHKKVI
jgi:hypothetical protein